MSDRLDRIAESVIEGLTRVFMPSLARAGDRCEALRQEGEDLCATLTGELPDDHPMSQYVALWRQAHGGDGE